MPALAPATLLYRSILLLIGLILFLDGLVLLLSGKIHLGIVIPFVVGLALCSHAIFYAWTRQQLQQKP